MKVFVSTPYSRDANSFWRCMGPLSYVAKNSSGQVSLYLPPDGQPIAWDRLDEFDLIFMHRPCRPDDVKLLQLARLLNIPVWSDYDDWLFQLPEWNPNKDAYHTSQVQHVMALMIACSDILSVSTTALQKEFGALNENTVLLPNAYRTDLFSHYREAPLPNRRDEFVWRGTATHDGDLLSVRDAFPRLSKKINILGSLPFSISSLMDPDKFKVHPFVDPLMYWRSIHQLAPKVWLFPLQDCFFNQCKSNISYMEAIHAGAICVAPDMPEWRHPGVVTYTPGNSDSFLEAAEHAMEMDTSDIIPQAYTYIKDRLGIETLGSIRSSMMSSIFHPTFKRNQRDAFNELTAMWALKVLRKEITLPTNPEVN